jgi:hypothetical protein
MYPGSMATEVIILCFDTSHKSGIHTVKVRPIKHHAVGGSCVLVWPTVAVVELFHVAETVHMEQPGQVEVRVGCQEALIRAGCGKEARCHLGVTRGAEIPMTQVVKA